MAVGFAAVFASSNACWRMLVGELPCPSEIQISATQRTRVSGAPTDAKTP